MVDVENLGILLDTSQAMNDLNAVESKRLEVETGLKTTQDNTRMTKAMAFAVAAQSWEMLRGVLKLAGVTISEVTNAVVRSTLNVGNSLYQVAAAYAAAGTVNPFMAAAAITTMIQAGVVIGSAIALEGQNQQAMKYISASNSILHGVNGFIGYMNW